MDKTYVVYSHLDDEGKTFYVGIGKKRRSLVVANRSSFWKNYTKKHCVSGKPKVQIDHDNLTWEQACEYEKFWISIYGRRDNGTGVLVNMTDGGDGEQNLSPSTIKRMSEAGKKRPPISEETRQKLRESSKGRLHTEEAKRKISETKKILVNTPEYKLKMSKALKGKKMPPFTDEWRQKLISKLKGRKVSEETRKKIRDSVTAQRKQNKRNIGE
jgi:hypothetical protein